MTETRRSGIGGLLRSGDGEWIVGFSGFSGSSDSLFAELFSLLRGLEVAWSRGIRRPMCYTNSLLDFDLISQPSRLTQVYASIVEAVKEKLRCQWDVTIRHTMREGNGCADFLAKLGKLMDTHLAI